MIFGLFFYVLSNFGAVFVNLGSYLVMPAGFVWGYIFFGESFTPLKFMCTILIVISILLIGNQKYKIKNIPIE
jgi:drug/metabolite transporter (DMT)-like permease